MINWEDAKKSFSAKFSYKRSQDGLKTELEKIFGDRVLGDLRPSEQNNRCVAAAIATKTVHEDQKSWKDWVLDWLPRRNPKSESRQSPKNNLNDLEDTKN